MAWQWPVALVVGLFIGFSIWQSRKSDNRRHSGDSFAGDSGSGGWWSGDSGCSFGGDSGGSCDAGGGGGGD